MNNEDAKSIILSGTLPPERNSSGGSIVYFIEDTQLVDAEIVYYTSAISALELSPNLQVVELPENLAVKAEYGLTIIKNANPDTAKLVDYILSPSGQKILAKYGFTSPSGTASASIPESQDIYGILLAVGIVVVLRKNILNLES
ncbi:substrate-binding domain-containing protein [Iningainema tapete]|uniref:Substrate-binding domain-containing protein n=1 Tax=Iningainema tapete BLCC-T55 TaxID=2748662 RepID=A0A8J6XLT8_9CYAN|nr:substrate-binding domain-containing protein [Iningainema tapete]MBD2775196.1 substrate-binding domain-containing protein [Iningainema tapete BLCC-T55]